MGIAEDLLAIGRYHISIHSEYVVLDGAGIEAAGKLGTVEIGYGILADIDL